MMENTGLVERIADTLEKDPGFVEAIITKLLNREKQQFEDVPFSGSASNWEDAASYCSDCLIDENPPGEDKTKDRCHLPYRRPGSQKINLGALRAIASGGRGLMALKGVSPASKQKAARKLVSWWPKAFGKEAPDSLKRMAGGSSGKTMGQFFKDSEDNIWFVAGFSNKFLDEQGDILSEGSHQEYVEWSKETGFLPAMTVNHEPRMSPGFWISAFGRFGEEPAALKTLVDLVYRENTFAEVEKLVYWHGFTVVLSKVKEEHREMAEGLAEAGPIKLSHGFLELESHTDFIKDKEPVNIIDKYRTFEVSLLVGKQPANVLTFGNFGVRMRNDNMAELSEQDRQSLVELFGEEAVAKIDTSLGSKESLLEQLVAFKDSDMEAQVEEKQEESLVEEEEKESPTEAEKEEESPVAEKQDSMDEEEEEDEEEEKSDSPDVKELVEEVTKYLNVPELQSLLGEMAQTLKSLSERLEKVEGVSETVKELKKTQDEAVAEAITPINWRNVGFSAAKAQETVVRDNRKPAAPPVAKESTNGNILETGFYNFLKTP